MNTPRTDEPPRVYVHKNKVFIHWPHLAGDLMTTVVNLGGYTDDVLGYTLKLPADAVEFTAVTVPGAGAR